MKILGKNGIGKIIKIVLIACFICIVPLIIYMPFLLHHSNNILYSMILIYPNGVLMLGIILGFTKLFKSLEDNNPFNYNNVKTLKTTGKIALAMSILWIIDLLIMILVMHNTYLNYIIVLIFLSILFFGVSISLYILSELFKSATKYKEENELTI